jgi:hypothetical protein
LAFSCQRAGQVLLNRHHVSVDASLVVVRAALNLAVLNRVSATTASRDNVTPLRTVAARPLATIAEVARFAMCQSNLHLHLALATFPVLHRPMQNVVDGPRESTVSKQVKPVPKHLANSLVTVASASPVAAAEIRAMNRHAKL